MNMVILAEEDYNSIQETLYLLSYSHNADRIMESIKQATNSQFVEVDFDL